MVQVITRGRESIEGDLRSGRPVEASSKEMCQKVEDMILQDRRVKVSVIAHELGISAGTVSSIIHSVLIISKVSSRWVPRTLTPEQKACRRQFSEENSDLLRANPENFFSRIITEKETCIHHHDPEIKEESMQIQGVPYSQEISCATISREGHGNSFWGSEGVLFMEFMPHRTSITGDAYASTIVAFRENIKQTPWKVVGWCPATS